MSRPCGARSLISACVWVLLLATGCAARPSFDPGDECELNTECATHLVCRLGRCRVECREQRDCPIGLECVRDADGLGACQLPRETDCSLASECPDFLVCRFGRCTNACERDVDCPPGARCEPDDSGMLGCRDVADTECALNSDCAVPYICAPDQRCREQCRTNRDCRDGTVCLDTMSPTVCGLPDADAGVDAGGMDAGTRDAGGIDAGTTDAGSDAGTPDAGGVDAGTIDAGSDAGMMAAAPPGPPSMGGGLGHTCAAPTPDALRCWGLNTDGQVGNGTTTSPVDTPTAVSLADVEIATGGASHSCARTTSGVFCWGANDRGQLGTGSAGGRSTSPVAVPGLPGTVSDLALGSDHTCAIAAARLFCWGDDQAGQIATGSTSATPVASPREVTLPAAPSQVTAFGSHSCARLDDGRIYCWGENGNGQVGVPAGADVTTPTEVVAARGASHVVAGTTHTCAIVGASVLCWGNNLFSQLGDGTRTSRSTPMPTTAFAGAPLQLALGSTHSCVRTATEVLCWGDNLFGQTGQDTAGLMGLRIATPTPVAGLFTSPLEVVTGSNHTCARDAATIACWGANTDGQLGSAGGDTFTPRTVPWT